MSTAKEPVVGVGVAMNKLMFVEILHKALRLQLLLSRVMQSDQYNPLKYIKESVGLWEPYTEQKWTHLSVLSKALF